MVYFGLNPNAKAHLDIIGEEHTPILCIDDALTNIEDLRELANQSNFIKDDKTFYPGVRASIKDKLFNELVMSIIPHLQKVYGIPPELTNVNFNACFSLIDMPERELSPIQRMPHFDTPRQYHFAILIYLNNQEHGPTAFFKHQVSRFERIGESRVQEYFSLVDSFVEQHGYPNAEYIKTSTIQHKIIHETDYRSNRMLIYPANILHSTLVQAKNDIDSSPITGRLTANLFIDFA